MLVSCQQMRDAEERLFATGTVDAESLMEAAGRQCAERITHRCPVPGKATLYLGKGNNGGDALVIGRELRKVGWRVRAIPSADPSEMSELAAAKFAEFNATGETGEACPGPTIQIDGLLGIGAKGALRGKLAELAAEMNGHRDQCHALTFAVDLPSGIDGDTGECYAGAVVADHTLTIAQVKSGLVADAAVNHIGRIEVVPLEQIEIDRSVSDAWLLTPRQLGNFLPRRSHDFHKGDAGRVGIVAGSKGMIGAAELVARGALRGGAGLVTVFADETISDLLAVRLPPEIMVKSFTDTREIADFKLDVLAIGPGLGKAIPPSLVDLMINDPRPAVLDADALNALAANAEHLTALAAAGHSRLLTPHPGEMKRLLAAGGLEDGGDRRAAAEGFAGQHGVTVLLKGARTVIAKEGEPSAYNSTGTPGMASGGMGDVLTGLCAALLASTGDTFQAACLAAWVAGRSAEHLVDTGVRSIESLSAADVADGFGVSFDELRHA